MRCANRRTVLAALGALGLVTTDLVNARSLIEKRPVAGAMPHDVDERIMPLVKQLSQ